MTDYELREQVTGMELTSGVDITRFQDNHCHLTWAGLRKILALIKEEGSRQVSGEPPIVEIGQSMVHGDPRDDAFNAGAKARRASDMRYYVTLPTVEKGDSDAET